MTYSPSTRMKRIIVIIILVMVGGSLVIPAATHAQDSDFEVALTQARDAAQAAVPSVHDRTQDASLRLVAVAHQCRDGGRCRAWTQRTPT